MEGEEVTQIGNLEFIPLKGLTQKVWEETKDNPPETMKGITYPGNGLEIECVIDDDCEACPYAVRYLIGLAKELKNAKIKIYNISYVPQPWRISATPAFRINKKVVSVGVPLDPKAAKPYFQDLLDQAYVLSHPKLEWLLKRIERYGKNHGFKRNPDSKAFFRLLYKLLRNLDEYGQPFCPCRPLNKIDPAKILELNKDKICPCIYAEREVKERGHCLCGLFYSEEKVREYVQRKISENAEAFKLIEEIEGMLKELRHRIISGDSKGMMGAILERCFKLYSILPE